RPAEGARQGEGGLHRILEPPPVEAAEEEASLVACGRPDHVVALAGEIVAPGTDPTGDPVLLPGHLDHAPPHGPQAPALREGDMRLALVCGLALLLASELDQVLERPRAAAPEGRRSSRAVARGGPFRPGGAAG